MEEFAGITTPFVKNKTKGEKIMSKEERHLQTKIRMFEDILLRTKNPSQVDNIQMELTRMRAKLQKLYFKRMRHGMRSIICWMERIVIKDKRTGRIWR